MADYESIRSQICDAKDVIQELRQATVSTIDHLCCPAQGPDAGEQWQTDNSRLLRAHQQAVEVSLGLQKLQAFASARSADIPPMRDYDPVRDYITFASATARSSLVESFGRDRRSLAALGQDRKAEQDNRWPETYTHNVDDMFLIIVQMPRPDSGQLFRVKFINVLGPGEKSSLQQGSRHMVYERIRLHAMGMHFKNFKELQGWCQSYSGLFHTPCRSCKKLLKQYVDPGGNSALLPATLRQKAHSEWIALHSSCVKMDT